jgi:uncharacterized protein
MSEDRPPLPPFTLESAIQKVRAAENAWNSCIRRASRSPTPLISIGETEPSSSKGARRSSPSSRGSGAEFDYRLIKELWCSPAIASHAFRL